MQVKEARQEAPRLGHLTYWDTLVAPGIMQQKDGSLLAVLRFQGPDLHSAPASVLLVQAAKLNGLFKRFGGGWGLMTEARRRLVHAYPEAQDPDPVTRAIDARRRARFATQGHYQTTMFLTLTYKPKAGKPQGWKHLFYDNLPPDTGVIDAGTLFDEEVTRAAGLLRACCPVVDRLSGSDLLTYLRSTVTFEEYRVGVPSSATYLDTYLCTTLLERLWRPPSLLRWPCLGGQWLRCVGVKAFPTETQPGMLDVLEQLPLEYRATVRYLVLDRQKAIRELRKYRKAHYGQRHTALQAMMSKASGQESELIEQIALDYEAEANQAQADVQHNRVSYGYLTQTVVVWDTDFDQATAKAEQVAHALNQAEYMATVEPLNTMDAWVGTLPGDMYSNVRRPPLQSYNLAHLGPFTCPERGRPWNTHLQAPAVLLATGRGRVPFWLTTHVGDVGHAVVLGPVGMGKSTFLALLAAQWRVRYAGSQVFALDKGGSLRCLTYAVGGCWYDMGVELAQHFHRGMSLEDVGFASALGTWAPVENAWLCFEMETLLQTPAMAGRAFQAIYHAILPRLTGVPTLLILDEGYIYLRHVPEMVQDFLKDLRKKETSVLFCAQSIGDYLRSPIAHDINEQCLTRIFLSNYRAIEPETGRLYEGLGLNERQREIIAHLTPKREYYYQGYGDQGNQVFDLELDPFTLAFVGRSRPQDQARMAALYTGDARAFALAWLQAEGLEDTLPEEQSLCVASSC